MPHAGGRPLEYDFDYDYVNHAEKYLQKCGREQTRLPKLLEFYAEVDISPETATVWEEKYPRFSEAVRKVRHAQQNELIDDGLFGGKEVNVAMAIFLLKVNHKMIETDRHEVSGNQGKPIEQKVLYEFITTPQKKENTIPE